MSDDERREVAERLRELNGNVSHVRRVYEDEGFSILCDDQADYYQICHAVAGYLPAEHMHPCDYEELHARLADLIDPDTTTDTAKTPTDTTKCDRDALLALADEMEEFGCLPVKHPGIRALHNDDFSRELGYARRIREALGVCREG